MVYQEENRERGSRERIQRNNRREFANPGKELDKQGQETSRTSYYLHEKKSFPRHIRMELLRIGKKERLLKAARGKEEVTYKRIQLGYQQTSHQKCYGTGEGDIHIQSAER